MSLTTTSAAKKTLTDFIDQNQKLLSTVGIFTALSVSPRMRVEFIPFFGSLGLMIFSLFVLYRLYH
jgi:hypothetical protein